MSAPHKPLDNAELQAAIDSLLRAIAATNEDNFSSLRPTQSALTYLLREQAPLLAQTIR
jgi:hypothetical protein